MNPSVLIVDDDPWYLDLVALHLEMHGFGVETAKSAEEALEALAARRPDALVSDVELPGMSGPELAATARGTDGAAELPVVFTTGYAIVSRKFGLDAPIVRKSEGADAIREAVEGLLA